ncbi:uncharacterized protein [Macrobrachium rosenbergii]
MEGFTVPYEVLWCQCRGNASATPHMVLIHNKVARMHADAQSHGLLYVGVVLTLYVVGLILIIIKSGSSERHSAMSAISFCCSQVASSITRRN